MSYIYAVTAFLSACLLFVLEPLVGKMVLPIVGGAPAAWNVCMVFFQVTLLAGYGYVHVTTQWLGIRRQVWLHFVVLLLPMISLPIALSPRLYESKIKANGILAFHITNRFLDFGPLLTNEARELGLVGVTRQQSDAYLSRRAWLLGGQPAYVVLMAHHKEDLQRLSLGLRWVELISHGSRILWTDDQWSVLSMLIRRR